MSSAPLPKATLYYFGGSVWAAVPLLCAEEKGFGPDVLEKRSVDLLNGDNFSPAYLTINPRGSVPTLVAPYEHTTTPDLPTKYKALTDSIEICQFLDSSTSRSTTFQSPSLTPATVQGSSESKFWVEHVHGPDAADPNAFLMSFRTDDERKAKNAHLPGEFLRGRQRALEKYAKEAGERDTRLAAFYDNKIKENGSLLAMYEGKVDASPFIETSNGMYVALGKTIALLEKSLRAAYLVGDQVSLADLHVGTYLARIFASLGAKSITDVDGAIEKLDAALTEPSGPKFKAYVKVLFERESFRKVYAEGLH
ncbi:BQ2448_3759 [Microbotryum intermedium]|uniref:BQ2448_3759 protein n=1 Tax=Microbotryum intermedium TaxID=269621 RepID=A0A238FCT7_9BASI|nr:BQ2448_3759 [Microbotryum intermedium]